MQSPETVISVLNRRIVNFIGNEENQISDKISSAKFRIARLSVHSIF